MHTPTTSAEQGLRPQIATYIDAQASQHDQQESLQAIAGYVSGGIYTIKDLIDCLGQLLVSEDDNDRGRAALLLGEVIALVPSLAQAQPIQQHLVQFLSSRLADWLVQAPMLLCSDASRARAASQRRVTGLGAE